MSQSCVLSLSSLKLACNGISAKQNIVASNLLEAVLHQPNTQASKVLSLKQMTLLPNDEYPECRKRKFLEDLKKRKPPLSQEDKDRAVKLFEAQESINRILFKQSLEGSSYLEINVSVCKENADFEKTIKEMLGIGVKLALGTIPIFGDVITELSSPALKSLFDTANDKSLKSLGKAIFRIPEEMGSSETLSADLVMPQDLKIRPIHKMQFIPGHSGYEIVEIEEEKLLNMGMINGRITMKIEKIG